MAESKIKQKESYQGIYPSVLKQIDSSDVMVNAFNAYKTWTIVSGSATSSATPLNGVYSDIKSLNSLSTLTNIDGSSQAITYFSINHLYYKYKDEPLKSYGPTNLTLTYKYLYASASILSIPSTKIGDGIKHESFSFTGSVNLASDRYSNIYDVAYDTAAIVTDTTWYDGFNEYFDLDRVNYNSSGVTYVPGVPFSNGLQLPVGLAAKFVGTGFIETPINGNYNRNNDYAISFYISGSNTSSASQLIIAKVSGSNAPTYPFKVELSGSNQLIFSAAGSTSYKTQLTSSIAVTNWTHVVCQKSGSNLQLYINGSLDSTINDSLLVNTLSPLSSSARIDNTSNLFMGGFDSQTSNLQGVLDEVRIFNKSLTNANISSLNNRLEGGTLLQTQNIGNVFSKQGIVVISSPDYRYNNILNLPFTSSYKSTITINELAVIAKLAAGDFNMSTNLTLTHDNDITYLPFVSGSDFSPYITTIGLYNDAGQLLAIGKLAQPIKKRSDVDMNFLISIDLDKNILIKG